MKDNVRVTAELRDQSTAGVELRMLRNGEWLSGRRFRERADAAADAERRREQLMAKGWQALDVAEKARDATVSAPRFPKLHLQEPVQKV
jgi:hypothetical protein